MQGSNPGGVRANRGFHDRIAHKYDDIYPADDPYWRFYREVTWRHLRGYLPRTLPSRALDLGCGTGEWGIRLLKSGFEVTFVDLSEKMLERAAKRVEIEAPRGKAQFVQTDLVDLSVLPDSHFAFATAQGDPLSLCSSMPRAVREIGRILVPGSALVCSVDNRCATYDYYVEKGDESGLRAFHRTGRTEWLARDPRERFPVQTLDPDRARTLFSKCGFEVKDIIGKIVLPLRKHPGMLEEKNASRSLLKIEESLHRKEAYLGRASHLQIAAEKLP